jgi:AmiR/NasT family two-component response regulator
MKTLIEMAREAGFTQPEGETWYEAFPQCIEAFAELVRADERKANIGCIGRIAAMVVDPIDQARLYEAMDAIRARSNT